MLFRFAFAALALLPALLPVGALRAAAPAPAAASAPSAASAPRPAPATPPALVREIAAGPFQANWASLGRYDCPEWFRDAKFGLWVRWDAQSVPALGDDFARNLYLSDVDPATKTTNPAYRYSTERYGPPSEFGFKDFLPLWTAEAWKPAQLMDLYRRAGARYFVALANDRDNFDCYDSKFQPWNSVAIGPHLDIVGLWAAAARAAGLRFGVSVHAARAWTWYEPAQGSSVAGPFAGQLFDGRLQAGEGYGKWWAALDPQDLYAQSHRPGTPPDAAYVTRFFDRTKDLIDHYRPDLLDFDDAGLPLGEAGLNLAAHFYNASLAAHGGAMEAVLDAQEIPPARRAALVAAIERDSSDAALPQPWQAETSLGPQWQYKAPSRYKSVAQIVRALIDVVSKNGNLLLDVPLRGDGTLDPDERQFLGDLGGWIAANGEGIYATRPWKVFGEGPSPPPPPVLRDARANYAAGDLRFTQAKDGGTLYVFLMAWPANGRIAVKSFARTGAKTDLLERRIASVTLLGSPEKIAWTQDAAGLEATLPGNPPNPQAATLKVVLE
jgi:alpha-L-fucosidase